MSWKGFQKGIVRTPQNLKQKMQHKNLLDTDLVYADAERRFYAIETQAQKLQGEARKYTEAVNRMLYHQIEYSKIIERMYEPISGVLSDPNAPASEQPNAEAISACQQYYHLMEELQNLLRPDLDMVETQIVQPCAELVVLVESVKKIMTKRSHKKLDLDRHTGNLRKVQDKGHDRSTKQEEKMFKVENEYEIALEEYNYYNDLLKTELPQLFSLEGQFIKPLFESFYFMQLNLYYTMQTHLEEMKIPHFDLEGNIVEKFHAKRGDVLARTEQIPLLHFTQKPERANSKTRFGRAVSGDKALERGSSFNSQTSAGANSANFSRGSSMRRSGDPPPYGASEADFEEREPPRSRRVAEKPVDVAAGASGAPPALPKRKETCTALYDYKAQSDTELSIRAGDEIEVLDRSQGPDGWWEGEVRGKTGYFPGSFAKLD